MSNYALDGYLDWGRGGGCDFLNQTCAEYTELNPNQHWFCSGETVGEDRICEADGRAVAKCEPDPMVGTLEDGCMVVKRFEWVGQAPEDEFVCASRDSRCTFRFNQPPALELSSFGLAWGPDARCVEFTESITPPDSFLDWPASNSPDCFDMTCHPLTGGLQLLLPDGQTGEPLTVDCPDGATIDARDLGYFSGTFVCPDNADYCAGLACPNGCRSGTPPPPPPSKKKIMAGCLAILLVPSHLRCTPALQVMSSC